MYNKMGKPLPQGWALGANGQESVLPFIYTTVKNYTIKCNRIQVVQYTKKRVSFEILLKNFTKETLFLFSISDLPVPY